MYCRIVVNFIERNRMKFDLARGLPRDCKFPMKSDTELKKYVKSAAAENDGASDIGIGEDPQLHKEKPKAVPLSRKPYLKHNKVRLVKRRRQPPKPSKIDVTILSEESDNLTESEEDDPKPKRGRRGAKNPLVPNMDYPEPVVIPPAPIASQLAHIVHPPAPSVYTESFNVVPHCSACSVLTPPCASHAASGSKHLQ